MPFLVSGSRFSSYKFLIGLLANLAKPVWNSDECFGDIIMDMCMEQLAGEWSGFLSEEGGIYHLIEKSRGEALQKDRIGAVIALGDSGDPRGVLTLMDCCRDEDPDIRRHATEALFKIRSGRAVHALVERMKDKGEQPVTRQCAAAALAAIRTYSAIEGLKDRFSDADEDPFIRSYVAKVMDRTRIW
jgi:HEAT repeat protein